MKTLIQDVTAVLMDEEKTVLNNAYVAVEDGKIVSVGTKRPAGTFQEVIHGKGQVLMPGFVNCHTHIPMTLLRGYGGGCDLQTWLNDYIFPAEARLDDRAVAAGTDLGLAEMIASGVTCIADMYAHTGTIAQRVVKAGISANLSCGGVYFGAAEDFSPETCSDCKNQKILTEEWHNAGGGQIKVDASIHGEYTSNAPLWQWMADYAREHDLGMHVHISETRSEHEGSLGRNGLTPIQTLNKYGVWDNGRAVAAHCVYTTPEDWAIMKEKGVSCAHNPYSNLKLGSGIAPIPAMSR
ncbi:MAG: amidohydrolase family protein, partial [Oscillospiraceae bacterium]